MVQRNSTVNWEVCKMNDRIKKLAEQAGYSKDYLEIGLPSNMEKFAELIVRECAEQVKNLHANKRISGAEIIREHFGVEE